LPVLFAAEVARALVGHLIAACRAAALYRRSRFLLRQHRHSDFSGVVRDREVAFPATRIPIPRPTDAEGVATRESALVRDGVLQVTCSAAIRRASLACRRRECRWRAQPAGRGNGGGFEAMLRGMGTACWSPN
jgi:PmbA protein